MKKLIAFLLAGMFALALFACNGDRPGPTGNTPTTQSGSSPAQDIYFAPKGVRIEMGAAPAPVLEALGEPKNTFESPSCALKAKDINYNYPGFVLTVTYPEQGEDYITQVQFDNDDYKTPAGITIGSAFEDVLTAYGTDYEEKSGHYYYTQGLSVLHFAIKNDKVAQLSFEYDFINA